MVYAHLRVTQLGYQSGIDVERLLMQAAVRAFEKRLRIGMLDEATMRYALEHLQAGLAKAGMQGVEPEGAYLPKATHTPIAAALEWNALQIAAFKNHHQTTELIALLVDNSGRLRTWTEFRPEALRLLRNYNINWLKTEYQTAVNAGLTAQQWQDYQAQRRTWPYLTYTTQRDDRVRDSHRALEGITRHIDDPWWDEYYPPNGWACRCGTKQSRGPETAIKDHARSEQDFPAAFRINPGKTGKMLSDRHPYFQGMSAAMRSTIKRQLNQMLYSDTLAAPDYTTDAISAGTLFRYFKQHPDHIGLDVRTGGFISLHTTRQYAALQNEMPIAVLLRNRGDAVWLIEDRLPELPYDALWNGAYFELKRLNPGNLASKIKDHLDDTYKTKSGMRKVKKERLLLHDAANHGAQQIVNELARVLKPHVKEVVILLNTGQYYRLTPAHIKTKTLPDIE